MAGNPDNSEVLLFIKLSLRVLRETYIIASFTGKEICGVLT